MSSMQCVALLSRTPCCRRLLVQTLNQPNSRQFIARVTDIHPCCFRLSMLRLVFPFVLEKRHDPSCTSPGLPAASRDRVGTEADIIHPRGDDQAFGGADAVQRAPSKVPYKSPSQGESGSPRRTPRWLERIRAPTMRSGPVLGRDICTEESPRPDRLSL